MPHVYWAYARLLDRSNMAIPVSLEENMVTQPNAGKHLVCSLQRSTGRRVGINAELLSELAQSPIRKFAKMFRHGNPSGERLRIIVNVAHVAHVTFCGRNLVVSPAVRDVMLSSTTAEFFPVFVEAAISYPIIEDHNIAYPWIDPSDQSNVEADELSDRWFERLLLKYRVPTPPIERFEMIVADIPDDSASPREVLPKYLDMVRRHGIVYCYGEYFMRSDVFDVLLPWLNMPMFEVARLDITC
jgi:hypothetical protein